MTAKQRAEVVPAVTRHRSWRSLLLPALFGLCGARCARYVADRTQSLERSADRLVDGACRGAAAAAAASQRLDRLDRAADEYRRVRFTATFDNEREALVFAAASAFRPDVTGPGYWVFTPARLTDGSIVVVNRGFVPDDRRDPKSRPTGQLSGPVEIAGALRWPDERHWFTPTDDPAHNLWFTRDPAAIAAAKALESIEVAVAPFYVEQEAPTPPGGLPQPGKLVVSLPDNHLQYALTWYGLAAVLAAMFGVWAATSGRHAAPSDRA